MIAKYKKPVNSNAAVLPVIPKMVLPDQPSVVNVKPKDYLMMFYGPPGVGKTTFAHGLADRVFFFSTDRGTRTLNAMRQDCLSWEDFLGTLDALESSSAPKYDLACIDLTSDMSRMCEDTVCRRLKVESLTDKSLPYGKGWRAYRKEVEEFIRRLLALDMGIVFLCHEVVKTIRSRSTELERTLPNLGKTAWDVLIPLMDIIGYCGFKTVKKGDERLEIRVLETTPREDLHLKDRSKRNRPQGGYELLDAKRFAATFVSAPAQAPEQLQTQPQKTGLGKRGLGK